ncbi:hypothetical protein SprV_0100069400 [Sparganum proliferum]
MMARDTNAGIVSEAFAVVSGVKQDCVLAPTLSSLMFSVMLVGAYRGEHPRIGIAYKTDDRLLNIRPVQASTRTSTTTLNELLFAEDHTLTATTEADMQKHGDRLTSGCASFVLTINTDKAVVMRQSEPEKGNPRPLSS